MFFGRTLVGLALIAGVVHVFRKDLTRIVSVLRKPTQQFLQEVKKELGNAPPPGAAPGAGAAAPRQVATGAGGSAGVQAAGPAAQAPGAAAAPPVSPPPASRTSTGAQSEQPARQLELK
jgi:hypothetical protein